MLTEQQVKIAIDETLTMAEASSKCKVHYATFKKYAIMYNLWNPNPGGRGKLKPKEDGKDKYALSDILSGKYPHYSSHKLKLRLIKEGIKEDKCEICGIVEWNDEWISMHLDHIDGNHYNHSLENLRVLCPNCHSQTETYAGKKKKASVTE